MAINFNGFNETVATFNATKLVAPGKLVKMSQNNTVSPATSGDAFIGVCVEKNGDIASVMLSGYVEIGSSGTDSIPLGRTKIVSVNMSSVGIGQGDAGVEVIVVNTDTTANKIGFLLK